MPKQNPKHQKKPIKAEYVRKRKKIPFQKRQILGIIFITVFFVSMASIVVISYMNQNLVYVEVGDTVYIKYSLWLTKSNDNWEKEDTKKDSNEYFKVVIGEDGSTTGFFSATNPNIQYGLIEGFYDGVIGRVNGTVDNFVYIEACVDNMDDNYGTLHPDAVAGDGWDDRYPPSLPFGRECKSYGAGPNVNRRLIFSIEILDIEKGTV